MKDYFINLHNDLTTWAAPFKHFFSLKRKSGQSFLEHAANTTQLTITILNRHAEYFSTYAPYIKTILLAAFFHDTIDIKHLSCFLNTSVISTKTKKEIKSITNALKSFDEQHGNTTNPENLAKLLSYYLKLAVMINNTIKQFLPTESNHINLLFDRILIGMAITEYFAELVRLSRYQKPRLEDTTPILPKELPIIELELLTLLLILVGPIPILIKSAEKIDNLLNPIPPRQTSPTGRLGIKALQLDALETFFMYIPWAEANSLSYLIYTLKEAALRHINLFWIQNYVPLAKIVSHKLIKYYHLQHQLYEFIWIIASMLTNTPLTITQHASLLAHTKLSTPTQTKLEQIRNTFDKIIEYANTHNNLGIDSIQKRILPLMQMAQRLTIQLKENNLYGPSLDHTPHRNIDNLIIFRPALINLGHVKTTPSIIIKAVGYSRALLNKGQGHFSTPYEVELVNKSVDLVDQIPDIIGANIVTSNRSNVATTLSQLNTALTKDNLAFQHPKGEKALTIVKYPSGYTAIHWVLAIPHKQKQRDLLIKHIRNILAQSKTSPIPYDLPQMSAIAKNNTTHTRNTTQTTSPENQLNRLTTILKRLPHTPLHVELRFYTPLEADIAFNRATHLNYKCKNTNINSTSSYKMEGVIRYLTHNFKL